MNNQDLIDLIRQNTRVILPEFGAFLIKDSGDKSLSPANITFSPFLRYNDRMIESYISKTKGISKEDANRVVQEFIESIKKELAESGSYQISTLGFLRQDSRSNILFVPIEQEKSTTPLEKTVKPIQIPESKSPDKEPEVAKKEPEVTQKESESDTAKTLENKPEEKKDLWEDNPDEIRAEVQKKTRRIEGTRAKVEKLTITRIPLKNLPVNSDETAPPTDEEVRSVFVPIDNQPETPKVEETPSEPEKKVEKKKTSGKSKVQKEITPVEEPVQSEVKEETTILEIPLKTETEIISEILPEKKESEEILTSPVTTTESTIEDQAEKGQFKGLFITLGVIAFIVVAFFIGRSFFTDHNKDLSKDSLSSTSIANEIENTEDIPKTEAGQNEDAIDRAFNEIAQSQTEKQDLNEEQIKQEETVKQEVIRNAEATVNSSPRFYIVLGSFRNQNYANDYAVELNKKGFKTLIVIQPTGMYSVTIDNFSSRNDALNLLKTIQENYPKAWILKQ